jgi:hypothetical protein
MKDIEARGLVLQRLYDIRHDVNLAGPQHFKELESVIPINVIPNILSQLSDKGLVTFKPHQSTSSGRIDFFQTRITGLGVDVIEQATKSPIPIVIPIKIDQSVRVHGSQNVQIGGQGNTQTVTMDFDKLNNIVESSDASVTEKQEAKSLLQKIASNKLVQRVLMRVLTGSNQS